MLFKQDLNQTDFSAIRVIPRPNAAYNIFISSYKDAFNTAFPLIETKLCKRYIKKEPWVSIGLLTSLRTKYELLYKRLPQ